jgi:hypothetical protein
LTAYCAQGQYFKHHLSKLSIHQKVNRNQAMCQYIFVAQG